MSVFIPVQKKGNAKECSDYHIVALISHASKVMLKTLQARPVRELRTFRCTSWIQKRQVQRKVQIPLDLEEAEIKLPTFTGSQRKQGNSRKNIYFCFIDYVKAFDCVDHNKLWKISRDGNSRLPYLPPEKSVCRSRSNSQNRTWSKGLVQNREMSIDIVTLLV